MFKQGLTYKGGSFRTPSVNLEIDRKLLIIKEKWLIFLGQPFDVLEVVLSGGEWGIGIHG
ncbi:hypothetical protein [Pedobacter sp. NJ-S-72]